MAASTSGYSKSQPSGSSSIRDGDDMLRSDKSILEAALNDEHYFTPQTSASSASGGIHRKGSARVFTGTRASLATPSSADSDGRLYYATDTESLHILQTSSHSTIVGGLKPFGVRVSALGGWATTSGTSSVVSWSAENWDDGGFYTSTTTTRVTIPSGVSGRFMVWGATQFPSPHTGAMREVAIYKNGLRLVVNSQGTSATTYNVTAQVMAIDEAKPTDYYELYAWQDAGVNVSIVSSFLAVQKIT